MSAESKTGEWWRGNETLSTWTGGLPRWSDLDDPPQTEGAHASEAAAGWPLLCLYCIEERDDSQGGSLGFDGRGGLGGHNPLTDWDWSWSDAEVLPIGTIWWRFAANALLFGAAWFVLLRLPMIWTVNRAIRRRLKGRCPWCGYDRRESDAARCPECGREGPYRPAIASAGALCCASFILLALCAIGTASALVFVANEPYAPIHRAAVNGDVEAIRAELARGVDVDLLTREYASAYPATPLSLAALSGQGDAIRCLVDAGADVDARGLLGKTPLHLAAMWGSFDAVEALIEAGADVNATDDLGWPPLVDAISRGSDPWGYCEFDPRIMRALIDAGADVELQPAFPGLLFHACYFGTTEALQILLESGTALEPEAIDLGRLLPDSTVIRRDPVAVARILIERGVPVNDHAMRRAVSMNNMELLELLLEHGGDVTSRNEDGETLLFVLRPADENRRLFALLLDHGVDINALNHRGTSVLMHWLDQPRGSDADLAVLREWVAILLECGADPAISYRPIFGTYDEEIADMLRRAMEDSGEDGDDQ